VFARTRARFRVCVCVSVFVCLCVSVSLCLCMRIFVSRGGVRYRVAKMCVCVSVYLCVCVPVSLCACVSVSAYLRVSGRWEIQGGEDASDAFSYRSLSAKEPLIIEFFCGTSYGSSPPCSRILSIRKSEKVQPIAFGVSFPYSQISIDVLVL